VRKFAPAQIINYQCYHSCQVSGVIDTGGYDLAEKFTVVQRLHIALFAVKKDESMYHQI
jgi:hypothetical protein